MKTNKYFYLAYLVIIVFFSHQCASTDVAESRDVTQSKIYQAYDINYNEETADYYAEALFRFGGSTGTTLHLSDSSNVTLNGMPLSGDKLLLRGYVYSLKFEKNINNLEFVFTDLGHKKYTNTIVIEAFGKINIPDSFSKSKGCEISWGGKPLRKNEKLTVRIDGNANTSSTVKSDITGSNSLTITPENIQTLATGMANIRFIRTVGKDLDEAAEIGGNIRLECSSVTYVTKILP